METIGEPVELGYGVLSIKRERGDKWTIAGSDGVIHEVETSQEDTKMRVEEGLRYGMES